MGLDLEVELRRVGLDLSVLIFNYLYLSVDLNVDSFDISKSCLVLFKVSVV